MRFRGIRKSGTKETENERKQGGERWSYSNNNNSGRKMCNRNRNRRKGGGSRMKTRKTCRHRKHATSAVGCEGYPATARSITPGTWCRDAILSSFTEKNEKIKNKNCVRQDEHEWPPMEQVTYPTRKVAEREQNWPKFGYILKIEHNLYFPNHYYTL